MKKVIYIILFIAFFMSFNNVIASNNEYNINSNIKKAILVENYIKNHKAKIDAFIVKYDIKSDPVLEKSINELDKYIQILQKIQKSNINKENNDKVISLVIKNIKKTNESLKLKLKYEKRRYEYNLKRKKEIYWKLWIRLSIKIDDINLKIANKVLKSKNISIQKKLEIKQSLVKLNRESQKLKKISNINFKSEKEIKDSFIRVLKNIKREVNYMKLWIKKD